jgi:iron complex transport system substrate-binding protein
MTTAHTSRRRHIALLGAVLTAALAFTACGGDDATDEDAAGSDTTTADAVTIDHRYGSTTLEGTPERIVTLDNQWLDVLVALEAPVVGAALDPSMGGERFPWQDDLPAELVDIPVQNAIPYEAVAALEPDLIVVSWGVTDEQEYERLSAIAPTIPLLGDEEVDAWQDMATVAGEVLGRPDDASDLVASVDAQVAELAAELPGLEGATFALANIVPGDSINVVADPDDGASAIVGQLGMEIDPELVEQAAGSAGRLQLSLERIDELDSDVLVVLTNGVEPSDIPGFEQLPAVRNGSVAVLDLADVSGLNTPSPLSVPYSLERIRPALEAAAG